MNIEEDYNEQDPTSCVNNREFKENFTKFCTYVCLYHNKKLNIANIFLILLKSEEFRRIFKELCSVYTDYEMFKVILDNNYKLYKSKYVKKYLNKNKKKVKMTFRTNEQV